MKTSEVGIAKNTAAAIQFLDSCEAVGSYVELNDDWLEFSYDPAVEVSVVPDHLVWFEQANAPSEAVELLNDAEAGYYRLTCTAHYEPICNGPFATESEAKEYDATHRVDGGVNNPPPSLVQYCDCEEEAVAAAESLANDYRSRA